MGEATDKLCGYRDRIARLDRELADLNRDKSAIYKEMRADGFEPKMLRRVIADIKRDAETSKDAGALYRLYRAALEGFKKQVLAHAREADSKAVPVLPGRAERLPIGGTPNPPAAPPAPDFDPVKDMPDLLRGTAA